jgi:flagellar biosynthesis chaperone FliJ
MNKQDVKNLRKRYLIWLYKTTKEEFDKYERKFTQTDIDKDLLLEMENQLLGVYLPHEKANLEKFVNQYREYISGKEKACLELKYQGKKTNPEFIFLDVKLNAVEKLIVKELGRRGLERIKALYELEMAERILRSAEH